MSRCHYGYGAGAAADSGGKGAVQISASETAAAEMGRNQIILPAPPVRETETKHSSFLPVSGAVTAPWDSIALGVGGLGAGGDFGIILPPQGA